MIQYIILLVVLFLEEVIVLTERAITSTHNFNDCEIYVLQSNSMWGCMDQLHSAGVGNSLGRTSNDHGLFFSQSRTSIWEKGQSLMENAWMATCWSLWTERNRRVFEDNKESLEEICFRLKIISARWTTNHKFFKSYHISDVARNLGVLL